ncbi:sugar transferase [Paenarthrobacter ureafaciens]|uniref:sugar transferase n=1 Tax=Paenarthrobacter ureafaciens TaxID=37931 RepID=UPI0009AC2905|nr:sugar transferase [Paenarthrobacter ureafaciens]GLU61370.1 sugar transferase [Paenarthrobacter ureafaciens]GLU78441.1 sugar transferase [Paenarthrobacter ureafaciens]
MRISTKRYDGTKRVFDAVSAGLLLVVSLPVQVVVAAAVAAKVGRPVLFRQPRPGRDGVVFTLLKFRSMKDVDTAKGLISDEARLTSFGRKLRSTSLDELPTLWNVLRGDMSMVGPRPLLVEYLGKYTPEQARRHEVRPGVTGLAQVNGRNSLDWDEKFKLDVDYVDNRSFGLDARILWNTLSVVFSRQGISAQGHATIQKFGEEHAH